MDSNERYVYLAIADNANEEGQAFPSLPTICEKTRLSESTVRRAIATMEKSGWLTVVRGKGAGNRSKYTLKKMPDEKVSTGKVSVGKVSVGPKKGVTVTEKGVSLTEPPHPLIGVNTINRQEPAEVTVISLPAIGGKEFQVTQKQLDFWSGLYLGVNVMQELRKMVGWLDASPKRRKTVSGMARFVNSWLSREQDKPNPSKAKPAVAPYPANFFDDEVPNADR